MITSSLNGRWEVRNKNDDYWLPATVPGTILGMLVENGVCADPYYRDNEKRSLEMFHDDYEYRTAFEVSEAVMLKKKVDLVCHGLDTLATIFINEEKVAETNNMHRVWRIPVKEFLHVGQNDIRIEFASPLEAIANHQPTPGKEIHYIPTGCREGNQYLRKAHSQFGWDWGPQLPDCGIWRDIELEAYDVRISKFNIGQNYLEEGIEVVSYVEIEGLPFEKMTGKLVGENRYALLAQLTGPDDFSESADCEITVNGAYALKILVKEPKLWWPNGYGAHPLYELKLRLIEKDPEHMGDDVEQFISHKKIFEREKKSDVELNSQNKKSDGMFTVGEVTSEKMVTITMKDSGRVPDGVTFADLLGITITQGREREHSYNEAGFADDGMMGVSRESSSTGAVDDWFSNGVTSIASDDDFTVRTQRFERYRSTDTTSPVDISFSSESGLFSIAIDDNYGHVADPYTEGGFSSDGPATPFDNMSIGESLFGDDDDSAPAASSSYDRSAPPVRQTTTRTAQADVRSYGRAKKSVIRSAAVSVHPEEEKKISLDLSEKLAELEAPTDENGQARELTAAEQMLRRMLVKKTDTEETKQNQTGAENYVPVVESVKKVHNVSLMDTEEDRRNEERALKAVAYRSNEAHHSAGQTVVSDTDAMMWILDQQTKTIGLRSITISQEEDEWGEEFAFCVNGVKIFARGGNYIPQDSIYGWITEERITNLIQDCVRSHFNMIRVWGGGYYPSDKFYDLCDRYGLIVWEDAMFACNVYDVTEDFEKNVEAEIIDNISRIQHHASLGLICGNNEIESAWTHWEGFSDHSNELKKDYGWLFETVLPKAVAKDAPFVFYWPSSPSSFGGFYHPDDENYGDSHYWDIWHGKKPVSDFQKHYFRFVSEFGFQAYPNMKTLESFTRENDRNLFSKMMDAHQKDESGNNKLFYYVSEQFLFPKDFESGVYLSQIMQGTTIKSCVDHLRRNRGRCMGALYWQINDCWPCISWSGIDYFGRWKALQYMAAKFYAPIAASIQKEGHVCSAYIQNETLNPVRFRVTMRLVDMDFAVWDETVSEEMVIDSLSAVKMMSRDYAEMAAGHEGDVFVEAEFENLSTGVITTETETLIPYKSLKLENPEIEVMVTEELDKFVFYLRARRFAPYVELCLLDSDALFGDNFFSMTKPEHQVYLYKRNLERKYTCDELMDQLVIRSLYDSYSYD